MPEGQLAHVRDVYTEDEEKTSAAYHEFLPLREEAFTATGGKVVNAKRVVRTGEERNRRWDVTVEPDGDGDVTLVLGTGPACTAAHALCTEDGRQLSAARTVTVPGPEEEAKLDLTASFVSRRALEARFGYGIALIGGGWTGVPEVGLGPTETGREYLSLPVSSARTNPSRSGPTCSPPPPAS